jgi:hypothetical protein
MLTTDASEEAWAAHLEIGPQLWHTFGFFYPSDNLTSCNQRETAAVLRGLSYFKPTLHHLQLRAITIRSDNAVTVHNLRRQGAGIALLHLTRAIFSLLEGLDVRVHACHIPGVQNVVTDAPSRLERTGDYEIRLDVYQHAIATLQVRPTVDLFAANHNSKCPTFVALSKSTAQGAAAIDAFELRTWNEGLPYAFPPVQVIGRCLQRITEERTTAVVVVPKWPGQPWWSIFRPIARVVLELGSAREVLIPGPLMRQSPSEKKLPPGLFLMALICPPT